MTLPTAASLFERLPRFFRRHKLMLGWMKLTGESALQLVRIRDESFGFADMSDGFLRLIVIDGDFEADFFRIADALLARGGVFIDAGANYGLLSFGMAGQFSDRVNFHLFEPNPKLVPSIHKSLALYPQMRCKIHQTALSDHEGSVTLLFNPTQSGASHIASDGSGEEAASTTLDHYFEREHLKRIELLKMDVEGFEMAVLRGARRSLQTQSIRAVYFEYFQKFLGRVEPPGDVLEFLESFEYEVCFCRSFDLKTYGAATHTLRKGLPGHGLQLLPIRGHVRPKGTDLLAVPKGSLVPLVN